VPWLIQGKQESFSGRIDWREKGYYMKSYRVNIEVNHLRGAMFILAKSYAEAVKVVSNKYDMNIFKVIKPKRYRQEMNFAP
jgi:hypothetical protein